MLHIAGLPPDATISSELISQSTHVPAKYLSKVLRDLVIAKLITSQRGPRGGFALAKPAKDISLHDVVQAVDPFKRIESCPLGDPNHVKLCPLHRRLDDAISLIEQQFRVTSLAEIIAEAKPKPDLCRIFLQPTLPAREGSPKKKAKPSR